MARSGRWPGRAGDRDSLAAMVMTAADALEVLELLEAAGIEPWLDGGWGVDALLGVQTREHADLDLTIPVASVASAARELLEGAGFATLRDWLPVALALRDPRGREVALHPLAPSPDGGGDQAQPDGAPFH
jgi:lincosamide nucleotidyltransferase A/C/D/E